MDALLGIWPYVLPFLVVITILVFVHELGHYLVARWNGVRVEVFSIGFGRELFGWTDKVGTRWKFSLIPLGGYVKMYGDQDESSRPVHDLSHMSESEKSVTLTTKKPWQKIAISAAGPIANYIFAIVVLFVLYATVGQRYIPTEVSNVIEGSAAQKAGIQVGDVITKVDHAAIKSFTELHEIILKHPGLPLELEVVREGHVHALTVIPGTQEIKDRFGVTKKVGVLGISRPYSYKYLQVGVGQAFVLAVKDTYELSASMLEGLRQIIVRERSTEELGGVLRIAKIAGDMAQTGIANLILLMAFLSINLGLINLFPIPVLDGGHIVFYTLEAIRGKPLSEKIVEYAYRAGFFVVIGVMLLSFWNDLMTLGVVKWVTGLWG